MAETSVVKTPTQGPPPNIGDLDTDVFTIITKNPAKVRGCQIYNIDYNSDKKNNRFVSPTFLVRQVTIGLVESSDDFKKDDSPNYFITVRQSGEHDTGDTDELFAKVRAAEGLMEKEECFTSTTLSSNIKAKEGKDPAIFFKLKYAKKPVKDPNNPKKTKRVTDKTRLSTKFFTAKKIDGKNVLVPLEFDPKEITQHIVTNSVMEAHMTFDYGWQLNGNHGLNLHLDKVIILPPKNVVRASDMSMDVPDYMVASDSEEGGTDAGSRATARATVDDADDFADNDDALDGDEPEPSPEPERKKSSKPAPSKERTDKSSSKPAPSKPAPSKERSERSDKSSDKSSRSHRKK